MRAVALLLLGTASGCVDLTIRPLEAVSYVDAGDADAWPPNDVLGSEALPTNDAGMGLPVSDCATPQGLGWTFESGGLMTAATGHVGTAATWMSLNDGTDGSVSLDVAQAEAPLACGGTLALRLTASGFSEWGSGMRGFFVHQDGMTTRTLNAAGTKWLRFTARSREPATLTIRVEDLATWPKGGVCSTCRGSFETSVMLGPLWRLYDIDLTRLALIGTVVPTPSQVDRGRLVALTFTVWRGADREVWLDNVELAR